MATKPPVKSKISTAPKSNTAKGSGLNKAVVFNKKLVALIALVLIVAVGYLYVRLSHAAAYIWMPSQMKVLVGTPTTKNNRPAIYGYESGYGAILVAGVNSYVSGTDTYCADGYSSALTTATLSVGTVNDMFGQNTVPDKITSVVHGINGNFTICFIQVGGDLQFSGGRYVWFNAYRSKDSNVNVWLYSIYRQGSVAPPAPAKV